MPRTLEEILEPVQAWLQPISDGAPAGTSAKFDPAYEALRAEVMKLDSPRAETVDWKAVLTSGADILTSKSKDLLIGSHVAVALYRDRGFEGLAAGTALLAELVARFWEHVFPPLARVRARVGAVEWYLDKTSLVFAEVKTPAEKDRKGLEDLKVAFERLRSAVTEKLAENAPAMTPLREIIDKALLSLPKPPPKPPDPGAASAGAPAGALPGGSTAAPSAAGAGEDASASRSDQAPPTAAAASSTPLPALAAAPGSTANQEEVLKFLRAVGKSLVDTGSTLRSTNPSDATAYRLLRTGLWLAVVQPPPIGGNGRTMVPALGKDLRVKLDKLAETGSWQAILEEVEGSLLRNVLNLDLMRYSAQAMAALGEGYSAARRACIGELRSLLERLPALPKLPAADGSPLADDRTKMWLDEEVLPRASGKASSHGAGQAIPDEALENIRKLLGSGQTAQALAVFEPLTQAARDGRTRAQIRLAQAELCRKAGTSKVAEAIYEALDAELTMRHMEQWEPDLVVECLVGRLACLRANKKPGETKQDEQALYTRLAQLRPSLAVELGG